MILGRMSGRRQYENGWLLMHARRDIVILDDTRARRYQESNEELFKISIKTLLNQMLRVMKLSF
jgi:hypothetical protein